MSEERIVNLSDYWDGRRRNVPQDVVRIDRVSKYGNPYKIGDRGPEALNGGLPLDRADVIALYRLWLGHRLQSEPDFLEPLRGKRLGCWCKPAACHGDVIVEFLDASASRVGRVHRPTEHLDG